MTRQFSNVEPAVDWLLRRIPGPLRIGAPLGLGKAPSGADGTLPDYPLGEHLEARLLRHAPAHTGARA